MSRARDQMAEFQSTPPSEERSDSGGKLTLTDE